MTTDNLQTDPVIEILRLAYRRGLAIQQEQGEKNKTCDLQLRDEDDSKSESKDTYLRKNTKLDLEN